MVVGGYFGENMLNLAKVVINVDRFYLVFFQDVSHDNVLGMCNMLLH